MPISKKAVVISNCQCLPLAAALTTFSVGTAFDFLGVHVISPDKRNEEIEKFIQKAANEYDFVLSIPLSKEFGRLSSGEIATSFRVPVISISNIFFAGYHPDLCYIGGLSQRISGPLGDYHSKLCLYSYITGRSRETVKDLFREEIYEAAGYFSEYSTSLQEMKNRDSGVEIPVSAMLPDILKQQYCFYSVNHPTSSLFVSYTHAILLYLEERGFVQSAHLPFDPNMCTETLANNVIFPIYPEIAARHGIPQFGSYHFKPVGSRVNSISLESFIGKEYDALSSVGAPALAATPIGQQILKDMRLP